jgi:5'-nucleotidase
MILYTNDDGIDAPGIAALQQAANSGVVIAPATEQSGVSHQVTVWDGALKVIERDAYNFAVHGTPADCVRLGVTHLKPETSFVLAGINRGGNLGMDVYLSGTVAAAREAAFHGLPAIAVSQYLKRRGPIDWEQAARYTKVVLEELMGRPQKARTFWNVNLPHLDSGSDMPEMVFCEPCCQPIPLEYKVDGDHYQYAGIYQNRPSDPGADVEICFSDRIAISEISL